MTLIKRINENYLYLLNSLKKSINGHHNLFICKRKIKRIICRVNYISSRFEFNLKVALSTFLAEIFPFEKDYNSKFRLKIVLYRIRNIREYLYNNHLEIVTKYCNKNKIDNLLPSNAPIWVFWWQGKENAPKIVLRCIESIQKHSCGRPVIFLDKHNFDKYVELPCHIFDKINKEISITHLSEIIRARLLRKWGGIWMDATSFLSSDIDNDALSRGFYTRKWYGGIGSPSQSRWSGFFMSGNAESTIFCFINDFLASYWSIEKHLIDYFILDYIISIGYDNIPSIKKAIDSVPFNNPMTENLVQVLNEVYDESVYSSLTKETFLHKLTWKQEFISLVNSKDSFYGHIMKLSN